MRKPTREHTTPRPSRERHSYMVVTSDDDYDIGAYMEGRGTRLCLFEGGGSRVTLWRMPADGIDEVVNQINTNTRTVHYADAHASLGAARRRFEALCEFLFKLTQNQEM